MLEFVDLVKAANVSPRFYQLIVDHYMTSQFRLHESNITLYVQKTVSLTYSRPNEWVRMIGDGYDEVLAAFETFGAIFNFVHIEIASSGCEYIDRIQSAVNKYCSNAFQTITLHSELDDFDDFWLEEVNITFPNASSIILYGNDYLLSGPIRLDIAFPQMQKLEIGCVIDLHYHYPQLSDVIISIPNGFPHYFNGSELSEFFRLNPQLRRIESPVYNTSSYLSSLSELPNLESLTLWLFPRMEYTFSVPPVVRFRNVKEFSLDGDAHGAPLSEELPEELLDSIEFDRVKSFSVQTMNADKLEFLFDMIVKNRGLRNVSIDCMFSFEHLSKLIRMLPQLNELTIIWQDESSGIALKQLLEGGILNKHRLEIVNVHVSKNGELTYMDLLEFIPRGWTYRKAAYQDREMLQLTREK